MNSIMEGLKDGIECQQEILNTASCLGCAALFTGLLRRAWPRSSTITSPTRLKIRMHQA